MNTLRVQSPYFACAVLLVSGQFLSGPEKRYWYPLKTLLGRQSVNMVDTFHGGFSTTIVVFVVSRD